MSAGPIKAEREGFRRPDVSTPNNVRVCKRGEGRAGYCGRISAKTMTDSWAEVVCADCIAAGRADGLDLPPIDRPRA